MKSIRQVRQNLGIPRERRLHDRASQRENPACECSERSCWRRRSSDSSSVPGFHRSVDAANRAAQRLLSLPVMASRVAAFWNHPAGPKTIHFWAPTFKWGISLANIADFQKPPEKISYPQQMAVTATGLIWSRYSMVITPKNWNLFSVNVAMAATGIYQLSRKLNQDYLAVPDAPLKKSLTDA